MTQEQVIADIEAALATMDPVEVRVNFESEDQLNILVLSKKFKDIGLAKRLTQCIELLCDYAEEVVEKYDFIVEPVTPIEFKDRLIPWPN